MNVLAKFDILIPALFLLLFSSELSSQPKILQRNSPEIPDIYSANIQNEHRKIINLNGEWNISAREQNINAKIQVPFAYDFKGKAVCTRNFNTNLENPDNWNYLICCDGINYQCEITINGRFIDKHEGGLMPFSSVIQEGIIKESGNIIEIKIDNTLDYTKTLPLKNTVGFPKNYGGIYRDIYILAVPKLFIRKVNLSSEIDINYSADISNKITLTASDISNLPGTQEDKRFYVKTEILDTSGEVKASSTETEFSISSNSTIELETKFTFANPHFWSPDDPHLYTARITLFSGTEPMDVFKCDFGVYELTLKSYTIVLNKTELLLKGVNYTEEFPGSATSGSYRAVEYDVKNLKSLGCNVIKIHGKSASPYLINICNRYGLLIFEELPVYNVPGGIFEAENFEALAENQLSEMILAHKNNPSVAAYGLGNDFDVSSPFAKSYVNNLYALGKKLDKKLIYYSTRNYQQDICRDIVDLVGINVYDRDLRFVKEFTSDIKLKRNRFFISSYGKLINPSNISGYSDPVSVEAQSKYIVDFHKIIKNSSLAGSFFIAYTDWNTDFPNLRSFDPFNQYLSTTGLFTVNRDQRPPAPILKKIFYEEDIPNLNIGTFTREAPIVFVLIGLFTFILFIYLANSVRRFRENVWRAVFRPFIFYTDVREQSLIPGVQNFLLALILSVGNALFFANLFYYWKDSQLFDIMLSLFVPADNLKIYTDQIITSPVKMTAALTVIIFAKIFLISVLIWLFSLATKFKIGFNNIYTVTVWGFLPTMALLIFGIFYVRVLYENPDFAVIGIIIAVILFLVSVYRILKGTYIIFDTFFLKAYAYGIIVIIILYGGFWLFLNSERHITDYFNLVMLFLKG